MTSSNNTSLGRVDGQRGRLQGDGIRTAGVRSRRVARGGGEIFRLHLHAHGQAQGVGHACPEEKSEGIQTGVAEGAPPPPGRSDTGIAVTTGRGEGGVRFVSFQLEAPGKGVVGIEIVERSGTAFLSVTAENEAVRIWIVERGDAIRGILGRCGLSLGGFDVSCRGGQGRARGAHLKNVVGRSPCGDPPPEGPLPARPQGELIG